MLFLNTASLSLLLASLVSSVSANPDLWTRSKFTPKPIPGKYIVQLKPSSDVGLASHLGWLKKLLPNGVDNSFEFNEYKAYSGTFSDSVLKLIKASKDVLSVEQDQIFYPLEGFKGTTPAAVKSRSNMLDKRGLVQQANAPWNLQCISQKPPKQSTSYIFDSTAGSGQYAYVVDTGINVNHADFKGRASLGYTAFSSKPNVDNSGHGTHAAGIIASYTWGVSKLSNIISVKVFDDASTTASVILGGYNWAVNDIKSNSRVGKSAINLAVVGGVSSALNSAIQSAYNAGIITVVGAGDDSVNVNTVSPASAVEAFVVGAVDINYNYAGYSNYGANVDLFAPGDNIVSTYINSNSATDSLSGTARSAAHVTGLALYFQAIHGVMSSASLVSNMQRISLKNIITGLPSGTNNYYANNEDGV